MRSELNSLRPVLLTILWALIALLGIYALRSKFDHDEIESIHTAWKMLVGERIYIDFFQHHHPFFYYSLMPVLMAFGTTVTAIVLLRVQMYLLLLLALLLAYRISKSVLSTTEEALLSVVFLASTLVFFSKAIEVRPDLLQITLGLAAVALLIRHSRGRNNWHLIGSAICLGLSFLVFQKAIFLMACLAVVQGFQYFRKEVSIVDCTLYWAAVAMTIAPYAIYLWLDGTIEPYWTFNWTLNLEFVQRFTPWGRILKTALENTVMWTLFFLGLRHAKGWVLRIGWIAMALIASLFLARAPYEQYFMVFIPFVALVAADAFSRFVRGRKLALGILLATCVIPLYELVHDPVAANNTQQLAKIQYVLDHTQPGDRVYDAGTRFNVFRPDVDFFWFSLAPREGALATYQSFRSYDYDIYRIIEAKRPKVISTEEIPDLEHPVIRASYAPSPEYEGIYLRK